MDILNRQQAQELINRIDRTRIPMSITPTMVASALNYLLNSVPISEEEIANLDFMTKEEAIEMVNMYFGENNQ